MLSYRRLCLLSILCALIAGIVLAFGMPGSFILDDVANIVENGGIRLYSLTPSAIAEAASSVQVGGTSRTIPTLTFALDYFRAEGLDASAFRATNIGIHVLTTLVLTWMLHDLLLAAKVPAMRARWLALGITLMWALHPLHVSSVLYIVQRMQTMATLFIVLSLWAYIKARRGQIAGESGRTGLLLAGLAWLGALGCKEDAVLLPVYLLVLELTVFRFEAESPHLARIIRRGFMLAAGAGMLLYIFVIVPGMWSWDPYPNRDFNTVERLLTQGRVLCMYVAQIILPVPGTMPFFYDWLQPSRGLMSPWTTLPSILLLVALLTVAYRLRNTRPLFAMGVLFFFSGHLVASNVIGLELAFEHRNHLPLLGIVIAVADLLMALKERLQLPPLHVSSVCILLLFGLGSVTAWRALQWQDGPRLAHTSVGLAPDSARAWHFLCTEWFEAGGGHRPNNPYLGEAISACTRAAEITPDSVGSLTNVLVFKTLQGTATKADWDSYLERLNYAPINGETITSMWTMISMVRQGVALDEGNVVAALEILYERATLPASETAAIGYFIFTETRQPERSYPFFSRAVQLTNDPVFSEQLIDYLRKQGRDDWTGRLQALMQAEETPTTLATPEAPGSIQ